MLEKAVNRVTGSNHESRQFGGAHKGTFAWLFALAVVVQTAFLLVLPDRYRRNDNTDYWTFYKPVGEQILAGNGIVDSDGRLATTYPPGYPVTIAFVFASARITGVSQVAAINMFDVIVLALCSVLVFYIVSTVFGVVASYICFFLWVTYPPNLWLIKQPNSEVPFVFFLLLSFLVFYMALARKVYLLGSVVGMLLGLAALVRPIGIFLPVLFIIAARSAPSMSLRIWAKLATSLVIGFLVSTLPWEGYLYSKTGQLPLLCTNGPATMSQGLIFGIEPIPGSRPMWVPADLRALMKQAALERAAMTTSGAVLRFVGREAGRNPAGAMELAFMKFYRPWYSTYSRTLDKITLAYQFFYLSFGLAGLVLGIKRYRAQTYWIVVLSSLVFYFWMMAFLVVPLFRYMVPAMTFILMFAALAGESIFDHVKNSFLSPRSA